MLPKLIYITQGATPGDHLRHLEKAVVAGVPFVQLRLKDYSPPVVLDTAQQAAKICQQHGVMLAINDFPEIAMAVGAEAVHVGLEDQSVKSVRELLPTAIIGGTANTIEHIRQRASEGVDYIGLGPFRWTSTKKKLSPVLGLEGYKHLLSIMQQEGITLPVYGIGGIEAADIKPLLEAGLHGVAISGAITHSADPQTIIHLIKTPNHVEHSR